MKLTLLVTDGSRANVVVQRLIEELGPLTGLVGDAVSVHVLLPSGFVTIVPPGARFGVQEVPPVMSHNETVRPRAELEPKTSTAITSTNLRQRRCMATPFPQTASFR